jgi:tetratricopeptide (TPR) repeat protein
MKMKLFVWAVIASLLGYFVLITPDNPVMRSLRGEISDVDSNIIIGPYPVQSDFEKLKKNGVSKIISLLDPAIPYEKSLLDQERVVAKQLQMELLNFPMISILGHKMGVNYEKNAAAAADEIAASTDKVYVHCYLGIHRAIVVKNLLKDKHVTIGRYLVKGSERSNQAIELDKAEQLFNEHYYKESRNVLDSMASLTPAAISLYAWVAYRQKDVAEARKRFGELAEDSANAIDATIGFGYCDLQENKLDSAVTAFSEALKVQPKNSSALTGIGLALYRQSKFEESATYLEKALQINPENTEAALALKRSKSL